MAYITYEQYIGIYGAWPLDESSFAVYAELASDAIDSVTGYKIQQGGGFSALPAIVQTLVMKATAAQVIYLEHHGAEDVMSGQTGAGFTVGKVHMDGDSDGRSATQMIISPAVSMYLEQTGLMGRCVPCFDQFRNSF